MEDRSIIERVDQLVAEEHSLRSGPDMGDEQRARLAEVEQDLDQCWDLLRQRRARRDANEDPAVARPRPASEVESYLQ